MDTETRRQLGELDEVRNAHAARLHLLELRDARSGSDTPPEVLIEIREIKTKLVPIDAAMFKLTYVGNVRADIPGNERGDNISRAVERTLERERRAMVARASDAETLTEVRLAQAVEAMRRTVNTALAIASAAIAVALVTMIFVLLRGT